MDTPEIALLVSAAALAVALVALFRKGTAAEAPAPAAAAGGAALPLRLTAYERLVLLCERISLPALIGRTASADLSAQEMRYVLIENIKQEYDYNASQQIYVSDTAWAAVRNLRDQSLLVINQVAGVLPPDARAADLNKQLLEVMMQQEGTALHTSALETLNAEAKKIMR
ncbi:hypothetical protein [Flaviaesturariibacter aridisoli]|uniref:Uncharacterized protein n=1 Tax=Flaviaesturariibacter aridisoli TaxID=2545761 RepID=A0A4R4DTS6_9BACT|nr:hypothetical protein [Flaviaesturariibacter aridisoli]TCZ64234.1 hypothetical protein E0486_18275 [Flaviaesturariibacter aridisoli]